MDAFFLKGGMIGKLECPKCKGYMTAPILQCGRGHNICDACKKDTTECPICQEDFVSQNHKLENISAATNFPCVNVVFGCPEMMAVSKLSQHGSVCPYRLYKCLVGNRQECKWRGGSNIIVAHVQEKHKEVSWMKGNKLCVAVHNFELPKEVYDCQLLQAHDELFLFHQHYSAADGRVYSAVRYIGPADTAKKFVYKITFASMVSPAKVSMTCLSHIESEDTETILKSGDCAYVEFRKLKMLVHDDKVKFALKVKKL